MAYSRVVFNSGPTTLVRVKLLAASHWSSLHSVNEAAHTPHSHYSTYLHLAPPVSSPQGTLPPEHFGPIFPLTQILNHHGTFPCNRRRCNTADCSLHFTNLLVSSQILPIRSLIIAFYQSVWFLPNHYFIHTVPKPVALLSRDYITPMCDCPPKPCICSHTAIFHQSNPVLWNNADILTIYSFHQYDYIPRILLLPHCLLYFNNCSCPPKSHWHP